MLKIIFALIICICVNPFSVSAIDISASSAALWDCTSDTLVYNKDADSIKPMASTTKIMTAICAIENCNTNIPVTIDSRASGIEGSSVYLRVGEVITVKELLFALMLNSGNDAAEAIAIAVSGNREDFVSLMNDTAAAIGALNTHFTNPSGLYEDEHYTTACDLARITDYAMGNPLFRYIVGCENMKISSPTGVRKLKNHNRLLNELEGCIGVKTGYTKKCGRCLVSAVKRNDKEYIAVTLNAPDDWRDHKLLYESID